MNSVSSNRQRKGTIISLLLIPLSGFATDIYIPSLPNMGVALQVSTIQIQLTLTIFLISLGVAQLFAGGILDSFGRYKATLISLAVFAAASLVIAVTGNIYLIYLMRVVHGMTISIIIVAKRAYFVDVFEGEALKSYLSIFTIIWSTGPMIAPFIGGYLQNSFGWHSNFYFLASFALLMGVLELIFGGETLKQSTPFNLRRIAGIYSEMIRTSSFTLALVMLGLAGSMMMVYNLSGPFIIEHHLHYSPIVAGYASLIMGLAWMTGGFVGKATVNKSFYGKLFINGGLQTAFVLLMIFSVSLVANLYSLVAFAFLIHIGAGYIYNNFFAFSMSRFPKNAGIAGGLCGGVAYIIMSIFSYNIVKILPPRDEHHLSEGYLILILLAMIILSILYRINRTQSVKV